MSAEEFAGYGFAAGDVRGTRAWRVDELGRLTGVVHQKVWRPGENVAECLREGHRVTVSTEGQEVRCSCGSPSCDRHSRKKGGNGHRPQKVQAKTSGARYPQTLHAAGISWTVGTVSFGSTFGVSNGMHPNPCDGMDPDCACGFYAYQEGSNDYYKPDGDTTDYYTSLYQSMIVGGGGTPRGVIGGVVRGYGKTVLGTRGFRSEKAEILALYVEKRDPKRVAMKLRLEHLYKVPTFLDYEEMLRAFPPTPPEAMGDPDQDDFWTRSVS